MRMVSFTTAGLSAMLAMAGCVSTPIAPAPTEHVDIALSAQRRFAAAELAFATAADGVGRLADEGALTGARALQVRGWLAQGRAILVKGKAATDTAELIADSGLLDGLAANLNSVIATASKGAQ